MITEVVTKSGITHVINCNNLTERISKTTEKKWYVFKDAEGKDVFLVDNDSVESIKYLR